MQLYNLPVPVTGRETTLLSGERRGDIKKTEMKGGIIILK